MFHRIPIPPFLIRDIFELPPFGRLLTNKDSKYIKYVEFLFILLTIMGYKTNSYVDLIDFLQDYHKDCEPVYKKIQDIYKKYKTLSLYNRIEFDIFVNYCYDLLK